MTTQRNKIVIPKEELRFKPRHKLKATKPHKDGKKYTRKKKHKEKPNVSSFD